MITIYLYENIIEYKEKESIKEFIFPKEAMEYGKIKNIPIFEETLKRLIQKEKWNKLLFSKTIHIILPLHYNELDKEILTVLLNNNGIKNIRYMREIHLLDLKKNNIIINLHNTYLTLIKKEKQKTIILFYPINIFKNIQNTLDYILKNNKQNTKIFFLGSNKNIPSIVLSQKNNKLFYYKNHRNYLITKYIP